MEAKLLLVETLSSLHAGTGQGIGVIDQPIAREKATGIPFVPGSSLKGVLRDACGDVGIREKVFGPDSSNGDAYAGAVNITDLRMLLLPVRSLRGVFAWVTSPLLLRRFDKDLESAGKEGLSFIHINLDAMNDDEQCYLADDLLVSDNHKVILEDLKFNAIVNEEVARLGRKIGELLYPENDDWRGLLAERICIVADDVMSFLLETGTEVNARIALDEETKTVKDGALWYEESLPTETILVGLVIGTAVKKNNATPTLVFNTIKKLSENVMQLGGSATVGHGLCKFSFDHEIKN